MIVRVLGEGQYSVGDEHAELLNGLDSGLEQAVTAGDETAFRAALSDLLSQVRAVGERLPDESLEPSDAVLPDEGSTLAEVQAMLAETSQGLIPG